VSRSEKIFANALKLVEKGRYAKASQTYWEAVEEAIRRAAIERSWPAQTHRDILVAASNLGAEDRELWDLFPSTLALYHNIGENWLDRTDLDLCGESAAKFVAKLETMHEQETAKY
jgi:hypothetical protein